MDIFDAIHRRRAVRRYLPRPVAREDIYRILDAANWAPSAMNLQQWEFLVVTGKKIREMGESFHAIVGGYAREGASPPGGEEFLRFARTYGGAPAVIVVLTDAADAPNMQRANLESASAAMENLLLAATALGLGTCWMTGPLQDERSLRTILDIPAEKEIVAVTPLGYPDEAPPPRPRHDPDLGRKVRWVE
ncbi:nitroreductase family protein [Methanoculleus sp. Wushi-C6]|uniref:Nitroreductase family protein n=1 Tax=Methanoculleus caldifontis TaxID=2651577 RepID=A0ABU3X3A2_9EURY|nr:nitroreductase family protein [Methanoculleus sp. Wushi-C6]MDV2481866.1 nitroreductase family protein [Methanoculleus sp. Wushi-C6]